MLNKSDLIVSCQALEDEPLHSSLIMGKMALAAVQGGASAIRANSVVDIKEIKRNVSVPIIGIIKNEYHNSNVYITPTMDEIKSLIEVDVDIIALDATKRLRPNGQTLEELVGEIKKEYPNQLLMADCSTIEEMFTAQELGFDYVGTTLFGYTEYSKIPVLELNLEEVKSIFKTINIPIIAEGNINTPELAKLALEIGSHAIVVGSMITRPQLITEKFAQAIK